MIADACSDFPPNGLSLGKKKEEATIIQQKSRKPGNRLLKWQMLQPTVPVRSIKIYHDQLPREGEREGKCFCSGFSTCPSVPVGSLRNFPE